MNTYKTALFPGSFDPVTLGHLSVVERSLLLFDKVIVGLGDNNVKQSYFPVEQRLEILQVLFDKNPCVEVVRIGGLTGDCCQEYGANYIVRGIRTVLDFEYEKTIAQIHKKRYPAIETLFLPPLPEHTEISSTVVRGILQAGGDIADLVPIQILPILKRMVTPFPT